MTGPGECPADGSAAMTKPLLIIFASCLFATAPTMAEVYKWKDSTGKVIYSDRPDSREAERVDVKSKRTDYQRLAAQRQQKLAEEQVQAQEQEKAAEQAKLDADNQARREENCRRAEQALASLKNAQRLYLPTADGQRRYLSDREVAERVGKAEADVREWCDS